MAFRWSKGISPLQTIKRGMTSLFVCAVVLLPLYFTGNQIAGWFGIDFSRDTRTTKPLDALQVRDIDKTSAPIKPFEQPLITVTFDDGWESTYTQALPLLQKYGIPSTQYVLSGTADDKNYMSFKQMINAQKAGHDIQCHSIDHANLTTVDHAKLIKELTECKTVLDSKLHTTIKDFASPYGASNATTIAAIKKTYRSHRNTNGDITTNQADYNDVNIKDHFNRYNIIAVTIRRETTVQELQSAIDYTIQHNGWLVLNYHQVEEGESQFGLDSKVMQEQFEVVSKAHARIVTNAQVLDAMGY